MSVSDAERSPYPELKTRAALEDGQLVVHDLRGREAIDELYELTLVIHASRALLATEIDGLLHEPCSVALGPLVGHRLHGILREIEDVSIATEAPEGASPHFYRVVLVPHLWLVAQSQLSRVFCAKGQTLEGIARDLLSPYGLGDYFAASFLDESKMPEYVAQLEESDWHFLQRWLERDGRFFFFDHLAARSERLFLRDDNGGCPELAAASVDRSGVSEPTNELRWRPSPQRWVDYLSVWNLRWTQRRVPSTAVVHQYAPRSGRRFTGIAEVPTPRLTTAGNGDARCAPGIGTRAFAFENASTEAEARRLASVRAEALGATRMLLEGESNCAGLRPGHRFSIRLESGEAREMLCISVEHNRDAPPRPLAVTEWGPSTWRCHFTAIAADVAHRPQRKTPWPRIDGVVSGHVESAGRDYAVVDEEGRYAIRLAYDLTPSPASFARIRMAQSYLGADHGTAHPLRRGAEVLVAHIAGDPDQPVIVGVAPNALTKSPVTNETAAQSRMSTASKIRWIADDLAGEHQ